MKYNIILTIAIVLSSFLTSCMNDVSDAQLQDFRHNYDNLVRDYQVEQEKLKALQKATNLRRKTESLWNVYKDSARNIVVKKEIVYIKRMASSSVMNSPVFYEKRYSGNTITENGRGAENEDFTVLYLSDGHIIKASPKENPEWLGTTIGEKALKITEKKLIPTIATKGYVDPNGKYLHYGEWIGRRELKTTIAFEYEDYITYQPLYSK